ncbi:MAG: hypothetical protein IJU52_04875 [Clostridia bacterium]|nr:hypothetical protein [Clostridia bacterium]
MGFGLLFVGLSLTLSMTAYGVLPSFIGCFFCMYACLKLAGYERLFKRAAIVFGAAGSYLMSVCLLQIFVLTGKNTLLSDFTGYLQPVTEAVYYLCHLFLLPALGAIARDTGRLRTARACRRNIALYIVMFALYIAANLLIHLGWKYGNYCLVYLTLSRVLLFVLTMVQVFACYMWICREGEEEEEQKNAESKLNARVNAPFRKKQADAPASAPDEEVPKWIRDKKKRKK